MKKKKKDDIFEVLALVSQISIIMAVSILGCSMIGLYIGKKFHCDWIFIIFFFLGALSGGLSVYKTIRKYLK